MAPFHRSRQRLNLLWALLRQTYDEYSKQRSELLAASLAFYTLLSMAPLLIIAVAICGLVLGHGNARDELTHLLMNTMGHQAAAAVDSWIDEAWRGGSAASLVGLALATFTASRVVLQLERTLNYMWNLEVWESPGWKATVRVFLGKRLFAVLLVLASGPILLLLLITRAMLSTTAAWVYAGTGLGIVVHVSQFAFSIGVVTLLTALVFKVVPDADVDWRSLWFGAALTSILFNVGNVILGLYLGQASVGATYGAAGSAIVVLLWLYFSAMFFLFGAEFTQTCARRFGRGVRDTRRSSQAVVP